MRIKIHCRRSRYFFPYWVLSRYPSVIWLMGLLTPGTSLMHILSQVLHNLSVDCFCRYIRLQEEGYKYNWIHCTCIHNDKMMCIFRVPATMQVWLQQLYLHPWRRCSNNSIEFSILFLKKNRQQDDINLVSLRRYFLNMLSKQQWQRSSKYTAV